VDRQQWRHRPQGPGQPLHHAERPMPGGLQELDLRTGAVRVITQGGVQPDRPNDVVVSPEGYAVFTDPQNWEVLKTHPDAYLGGHVLVRREDGTVELLTQLPGFPNGLIFHPNGDLLVNLTRRREVIRFRWHKGRVAAPELFCSFPEGFAPDGMCLTEDRLLVAGSVNDTIAVVDLDGNISGSISTGKNTNTTNICTFDDRLFITFGFSQCLASLEMKDIFSLI
jgi:gluconolactonase